VQAKLAQPQEHSAEGAGNSFCPEQSTLASSAECDANEVPPSVLREPDPNCDYLRYLGNLALEEEPSDAFVCIRHVDAASARCTLASKAHALGLDINRAQQVDGWASIKPPSLECYCLQILTTGCLQGCRLSAHAPTQHSHSN
jgi:hypothetical protein